MIEANTAGLPQDDTVRWLAISVTKLLAVLHDSGIDTTHKKLKKIQE